MEPASTLSMVHQLKYRLCCAFLRMSLVMRRACLLRFFRFKQLCVNIDFDSITRRKHFSLTHTHACMCVQCAMMSARSPLMWEHFREMFSRPVKWPVFIMNESICLPTTTNCVRTDSTQLTRCAALSLSDKNPCISLCRLPLCGSRRMAHFAWDEAPGCHRVSQMKWILRCVCFLWGPACSVVLFNSSAFLCDEDNATKSEPICADDSLL